jgi:hypothetical protein
MMKTLLALLLFTATAWAEPVIVVSDDMDLPQTIITSEGTYIVIPDYTTGKPMAVIETTKTDND